jgi:oxygen-independent coproporphyrinogen-3 oxidase
MTHRPLDQEFRGYDLSPSSPLIQRAREKLASLPMNELQAAGIRRDRGSYFLNIAYPSMQAMPEITPEQVYPPESQSKDGKKMAVYVHIPFCTAECYYCHYFKEFRRPDTEVQSYLNAALEEMRLHADHFGGIKAASIYFGGGTPSYVPPAMIDAFMREMKQIIAIPDGTEFSFEVHPESASPELLEVLKKHGVNRINIGVESFDDAQLLSENRRHTAAQAEAVFQRIRRAGFENVNLDLIYGLRHQTLANWEQNLETLARLQPDSMTMYYLRLKHGTPEYQMWKKHPDSFPTPEELRLMQIMSFEAMEGDLGYTQKPVDWFIRDPALFHTYQDHNWRRSDQVGLLGIGPSAYSYVDGWQYYNINDVAMYKSALDQDRLPIWKGEYLTGDEPMRRTIMMGIKMGIDRQIFEETYGADPAMQFADTWQRLVELGLVEISESEITLTYLGKLHADEVGQQFYSDEMKQRMAAIDPVMVSTTWPQFNRPSPR